MVRAPCCDKMGVKRGPWTTEEDHVLVSYIETYGHGNWRALPKDAGLNRCGKSCRLRWINYLRPDIKRGNFTMEEEETIIRLHAQLGNRWSVIAAQLPGRTDNEIKNFWHTYLKKRLPRGGSGPEPAEKQRSPEVVKPSPKTDQPLPDAAASPATLMPEQLQQPASENTLLLSPVTKDEPRTSCSSSWISTVSRCSDEFVDFSSVEVANLDEAFWTEALAMNTTVAEDQTAGECAQCGGRTTGIGSSLPVAITTTQSQCASATTCWTAETPFERATTCWTAETPFEDGTDFWLRLLVGAGNLPR